MNKLDKAIGAAVVIVGLAGAVARADVVITLELVNADNDPIATAPVGEEVFVNILLSVTADDDPLIDVRQLQFDARGTEAGADVQKFKWRLKSAGLTDDTFYALEELLPTSLRANYIGMDSFDGFIVNLTQDPVRVAQLTVVFSADAVVDVVSRDLADPDSPDEGARFLAGFTGDQRLFTLADNNIAGGTLAVALGDGSGGNDNSGGGEDNTNDNAGGDNDNTGTNDNAAENDNTSTNDNGDDGNGGATNGNGASDRNVGPIATGGICGVGMIGPMLLGMGGLLVQRRRFRTRR